MTIERELTKQDVLIMLHYYQGVRSLRQYAKLIGCSASYLSDVYCGRREPGPKVLRFLDLRREVRRVVVYIGKVV